MPAWDNVARRPFAGNAFSNVKPTVFEEWTMLAAKRAKFTDEKILIVNAWNEWAEGAYLEPDLRFGWANLDAFSRGLLAADADEKAEEGGKPIAIFVHVHYPEIWPEVRSIIAERVTTPFHLILTTTSDFELDRPKSDSLRGFEVHRVINKGRDILPFLFALERTKLDFDIGLKLHTKRSPHRADGAIWRQMLFGDLLPKKGCEPIVSLFREDPNLGFVAPGDHWVRIGEHLGRNFEYLCKISNRIRDGFSYRDLDTGRFIAGSMFWFRRQALRGLDLSAVQDMFVEESGQLDGTAAHAIERIFSLVGERNAYVTLTSNEAESVLNNLRNGDYPLFDRLARFSDQIQADTTSTRIALSKVDSPNRGAVQATIVAVQNPAPSPLQANPRFLHAYRFAAGNQYIMATYRRLPTGARVMLRRIFGLPT
jgi:lipopolysaccharide biosynthesis protein